MLPRVVIVLVCTVVLVCCEEEEQSSDTSNSETSNYGERLADSSYIFNSVSARDSAKEESNVYSPGINAILNSDGFLNTMTKYSGNDPKYTPTGPVEAAVQTKKTVEVIPVRFEEPKEGEPQVIEITPYEVPLSIVFKTQTNKIQVNQEHKSETAEEVKETSTEEEPHRVVHNVYRPVIQEVTEVVQPYRKVLQKVEPVIEEMKTIISKASPNGQPVDNGQQQQQQQQQQSRAYGAQSGQSSGFMGNDLGRGLNIIPLAYGSEVIKKLSSPPTTQSENEISRRYGFSNRNQQGESNNKDEPMENKATDYNDLIKDYINKFLEPKNPAPKQNQPQSNQIKSNINSIKPLNFPSKNFANNIDKDRQTNEKPKFKVIKEFRVTLNDLKNMKLAPFVLPQEHNSNRQMMNANDRQQSTRPNKYWANFNMPASASSFRPMVSTFPGPIKPDSRRNNIYNGPKRMGDTPLAKHLGSMTRRSENNAFSRRRLEVNDPKFQISGISPPNLMFGQESPNVRRSESFRRSADEQAFFESKRL